MRYWVYKDAQIMGPYTREDMSQVAGLEPTSLVCSEGANGVRDKDWISLAEVPDLSSLFHPTAALPAAPAAEKDPGDAFERLREAAGSAVAGFGYAGEWTSGVFEDPGQVYQWGALFDSTQQRQSDEAELQVERMRAAGLEKKIDDLTRKLSKYESQQNEILDRLNLKDRALQDKDQALAQLQERIPMLERTLRATQEELDLARRKISSIGPLAPQDPPRRRSVREPELVEEPPAPAEVGPFGPAAGTAGSGNVPAVVEIPVLKPLRPAAPAEAGPFGPTAGAADEPVFEEPAGTAFVPPSAGEAAPAPVPEAVQRAVPQPVPTANIPTALDPGDPVFENVEPAVQVPPPVTEAAAESPPPAEPVADPFGIVPTPVLEPASAGGHTPLEPVLQASGQQQGGFVDFSASAAASGPPIEPGGIRIQPPGFEGVGVPGLEPRSNPFAPVSAATTAFGDPLPPPTPAPASAASIDTPKTLVFGGGGGGFEIVRQPEISPSMFQAPAAISAPAVPAGLSPAGAAAQPAIDGFESLMEFAAPAVSSASPEPAAGRDEASIPTPGGRRRQSKAFLIVLGMAFAGLLLAGVFFLKDPKEVILLFTMGPKHRQPVDPEEVVTGPAHLGQAKPLPPGAGGTAPSVPAAAAAPERAVTPPLAQGGAAPEASGTAPAAGRDLIADNGRPAIELVKAYPLNGDRKNIGQWLAFSFPLPPGDVEWSSGSVGGDAYLVSFRAFPGGRANRNAEPVTYIFEVDMAKKTVRGQNEAGKELLAGAAARPAKKRPSRPKRAKKSRQAKEDLEVPLLPLPDEVPPEAASGEEGAAPAPGGGALGAEPFNNPGQ